MENFTKTYGKFYEYVWKIKKKLWKILQIFAENFTKNYEKFYKNLWKIYGRYKENLRKILRKKKRCCEVEP